MKRLSVAKVAEASRPPSDPLKSTAGHGAVVQSKLLHILPRRVRAKVLKHSSNRE